MNEARKHISMTEIDGHEPRSLTLRNTAIVLVFVADYLVVIVVVVFVAVMGCANWVLGSILLVICM